MKRLAKKLEDHGRKLNRVQLKRDLNKLIREYLELNNSKKALVREIDRLEAIHKEVLADRDKTIERTKAFNNNLADKLEEKIQEVSKLDNELDKVTSKYILEKTKYEQARQTTEMLENSLDNKCKDIRMLKDIIRELEIEVKELKIPWYKKVIKK